MGRKPVRKGLRIGPVRDQRPIDDDLLRDRARPFEVSDGHAAQAPTPDRFDYRVADQRLGIAPALDLQLAGVIERETSTAKTNSTSTATSGSARAGQVTTAQRINMRERMAQSVGQEGNLSRDSCPRWPGRDPGGIGCRLALGLVPANRRNERGSNSFRSAGRLPLGASGGRLADLFQLRADDRLAGAARRPDHRRASNRTFDHGRDPRRLAAGLHRGGDPLRDPARPAGDTCLADARGLDHGGLGRRPRFRH